MIRLAYAPSGTTGLAAHQIRSGQASRSPSPTTRVMRKGGGVERAQQFRTGSCGHQFKRRPFVMAPVAKIWRYGRTACLRSCRHSSSSTAATVRRWRPASTFPMADTAITTIFSRPQASDAGGVDSRSGPRAAQESLPARRGTPTPTPADGSMAAPGKVSLGLGAYAMPRTKKFCGS